MDCVVLCAVENSHLLQSSQTTHCTLFRLTVLPKQYLRNAALIRLYLRLQDDAKNMIYAFALQWLDYSQCTFPCLAPKPRLEWLQLEQTTASWVLFQQSCEQHFNGCLMYTIQAQRLTCWASKCWVEKPPRWTAGLLSKALNPIKMIQNVNPSGWHCQPNAINANTTVSSWIAR